MNKAERKCPVNGVYIDNIDFFMGSLNVPSPADTQEPSSASEAGQEHLSVDQENERLSSEDGETDVSPCREEDTAQAQEVEHMEDAPTHLLVEVRGCEVPSVLILLLLPSILLCLHSCLLSHLITPLVHAG